MLSHKESTIWKRSSRDNKKNNRDNVNHIQCTAGRPHRMKRIHSTNTSFIAWSHKIDIIWNSLHSITPHQITSTTTHQTWSTSIVNINSLFTSKDFKMVTTFSARFEFVQLVLYNNINPPVVGSTSTKRKHCIIEQQPSNININQSSSNMNMIEAPILPTTKVAVRRSFNVRFRRTES